ncbi:MAG: ATP-binding protein [Candidatus Binatia bacterium]
MSPARPVAQVVAVCRRWLGPRWLGVVALLVGLPLAIAAAARSIDWVGATFPGFLAMENAVVPTVAGVDWPPDKGRLFHAQVVAVDGEPIRSSVELYAKVARQPAGTSFRYTLRKQGEPFTVDLPSRRFSVNDWVQVYAILLAVGVLSLGSAVVVGFLRSDTRPGLVYAINGLVGGLFALLAVFLHHPGHPFATRAYFIAETLFPATFVHLALVFPVDRLGTGRRWYVSLLVPYGIAAALMVAKLTQFFADPPKLFALRLTYLLIAVGFVVFVVAAIAAYRGDPHPLVRPRLRVVLFGVIAGSSLAFAIFVDNAVGGRVPLQFGLVLVPAFFLSVGYAIVKHDLFDVDRIVRQGFVYGTLSLVVVGTYALIALVPARYLPSVAPSLPFPIGIAFVLVMVVALDPLRRLVQHVVDRAFYRSRLDYRRTIEQVSAMLATLLDTPEIVSRVTGVIMEAMQLEGAALCLLPQAGEAPVVWAHDARGRILRREGGPELIALAQYLTAHGASRAPEVRTADPRLADDLRAALTGWGCQIAFLLAIGGRSVGLLLLGPHRSGRPFDSDDAALLRTLAHQTAIALHNAHSYEALVTLTRELDVRVRAQTEEIRTAHERLRVAYEDLQRAQSQLVHSEKMTALGRLVAGVAHELNNPASFVHGSLENLAEYLETFVVLLERYGQVTASDPGERAELEALRDRYRLDYLVRAAPELVRICLEGSRRIIDIVADLRTFARANDSSRVPTSVHEGIDATLRLLGPRLGPDVVTVNRNYGEIPLVTANPGELNQVWMNLLVNAIDALEERGRGTIRIVTRWRPAATDGSAGVVEIAIEDDGPGIRADDLPHVFEPFFTTKPVGRGTGLGLSIAYGAVRSQKGDIVVRSEPGRGTTFLVSLPVDGARRADVGESR